MIRKLLQKLFGRTRARRRFSHSTRFRRFAVEPLESRRLLAITGSISGFAYLDTHDFGVKDADEAGFPGLTVKLTNTDGTAVSGVAPVQTLSDGSFSFTGLPGDAAHTYQIRISPSPKLAIGTLSAGSAGGTVGNDEIQLTLAAGQSATDYDFAILGAAEPSLMLFIDAPVSLTNYLTNLHSRPSLSGTPSSSPAYTTGTSGVAISPNVAIDSPDSPTLMSVTATIQDPVAGDQLSAQTTGTTLTTNYANGVLTITPPDAGEADTWENFQTVLQTLTYSGSSPADAGQRTVKVTVNDGTVTTTVATMDINVSAGAADRPHGDGHFHHASRRGPTRPGRRSRSRSPSATSST